MIAAKALRRNVLVAFSRCYSEGIGQGATSGKSSPTPTPPSTVSGLSKAVIKPSAEPVGPNVEPNKSGAYKTPEYYQYHPMSYYEAEVEMFNYRIPQPSALKK